MSLGLKYRALRAKARAFMRDRRANVAMIFALSLIPITIAAGAGLDLGRAMIVRTRLAEALDAAGLAVGATTGLSQSQMATMAQNYFNANYTASSSFGTPAALTVVPGTDANGNVTSVSLSTSVKMPTTLMNVVGIKTVNVGYTSQVSWGQTKIWVSLVLDNTGSMTETDKTGTSKISALKTATQQLLTTLKGVVVNPGDVEVALVPFSKDVNVGTSNAGATWIDWTDWNSAPASSTPSSSVGPGSSCPYTNGSNGFTCTTGPTNGASSTSTIPSTGSYIGYICPGVHAASAANGQGGHYYNGCYNSVATKTTTTTTTKSTPTTVKSTCTTVNGGTPSCTQTSSSTGSSTTNTTTTTTAGYTGDSGPTTTNSSSSTTSNGTQSCSTKSGKTTCTYTQTVVTTAVQTTVTKTGAAPFNHTWVANDHSSWDGCVMDRAQNSDINNTVASSTATDFPAENSQSCPPGTISALSYNWTALNQAVTNMTAQGSTNQPIGLAWGWQMMTQGNPMDAPALPSDTSQIIIILSDGLNTQDRWSGDGSNQATGVDTRMNDVCANFKATGATVYAVFVDLGGTQGNSTVLQNCATDSSHYYDLTTSGAIVTAFNQIATQITQLRVAK